MEEEEFKIDKNVGSLNEEVKKLQMKQAEEEAKKPKINPEPQSSGMAGWLIKKGIVKDEKQANYFLLALAIIIFIIAGFLFFKK